MWSCSSIGRTIITLTWRRRDGTEGLVEIIFAKQRKGPTGTVKLRFIKEYTRFIDEFTGKVSGV